MGWAAIAARAHVDPTGVGLSIGDEIGNGRNRKLRVHLHDMGHSHDARDRRNVSDEVVVEFVKQRRVDRGGAPDYEKRITICRCARDRLDADIAAAAWAILDDKLLADALRQPSPYQARGSVVHGTSSKGDDDAYRPRRIGLRPSEARDQRRSDSSSNRDAQKLSSR